MIRSYRPADREALYRVCLLTGDAGEDATAKYSDPMLVGEVFVGPYLALQPQFAFVVDGGDGAQGYAVGAVDTTGFAAECERVWWPPLRERYRDVVAPPGKNDGWLLGWIRKPPAPPPDVVSAFPSHLHIDLLPRWQAGGWGRKMIEVLCEALAAAGSHGVHLEVGANNASAIGFYRHIGFADLARTGGGLLMGRSLATGSAGVGGDVG